MVPFVLISSLLFCLINGKQTTVTVKEGEDAVLPFKVKTTLKVKELKVVWRHGEHGEKTVFSYKNGGNYSGNQDPRFKGRVSFFEKEIPKGNVSLRLTNVTQTDAGLYSCSVDYDGLPEDQKKCSVHLDVQKGGKQRKSTGPDTTLKWPDTQTNDKTNEIIGGGLGGGVIFGVIISFLMYRTYKKFRHRRNTARRRKADQDEEDGKIPPIRTSQNS